MFTCIHKSVRHSSWSHMYTCSALVYLLICCFSILLVIKSESLHWKSPKSKHERKGYKKSNAKKKTSHFNIRGKIGRENLWCFGKSCEYVYEPILYRWGGCFRINRNSLFKQIIATYITWKTRAKVLYDQRFPLPH